MTENDPYENVSDSCRETEQQAFKEQNHSYFNEAVFWYQFLVTLWQYLYFQKLSCHYGSFCPKYIYIATSSFVADECDGKLLS